MRSWPYSSTTLPRRLLTRYNRSRTRPVPPCPEEYRDLVARWMLRLLTTSRIDIEDDELKNAICTLTGLQSAQVRNATDLRARRAMQRRLAQMERRALPRHTPLARQLHQLAELAGLSDVEQELLAFAVLARTCPVLGEVIQTLGPQRVLSLSEVLAVVLRTERTDVTRILRGDSALCSAGLLRVDGRETDIVGMLDLLEGLEDGLLTEPESGATPFRRYCEVAPEARHRLDAFSYLSDHIEVLRRLLDAALQHPSSGLNVLIYGESGTGKTEFVKALATSLNATLFQVGYECDERDPSSFRFRAYLLAQKLLARNTRSLILFDEVEDVFPVHELPWFGPERRSGHQKAWTNAALETNPRPTFWVCNEVRQIDPALRRRFAYALELRTPPRSVRRAVLAKTLESMPVRPEWLDRMADHPNLTPALIAQASRVARLVEGGDPAMTEALIERVIRQSLDVLGCAPLEGTGPKTLLDYSVEFLNTSHDLEAVVKGLKARPVGRLCLYGPPGSGKTAFAHYLAGQLDRPLLERRASDLLSCWVGETEQRLAQLFRDAVGEGAVILLDEADSFLRDRRETSRSWEVTRVNELLKQMETFEGICLCATNMMEDLDQAVLRRFDLKIRFHYLTAEQAFALFVLALASTREPGEEFVVPCSIETRLARLTTLTPGDFTTVLRQERLLGERYDAEALFAALEAECRAKDGNTPRIAGFALCEDRDQ